MRTISKILGTVLIVTLFVGCSPVKVTNSWKDVKTSQLKDKSILVMSKTNDDILRIQSEQDIVENLSKKGYKSLESYKKFPNINADETLNKEQLKVLKNELKSQGIDVVVLTVLKDVQEFTKTTTSGGSGYYMSTSPVYYSRGYRRGFYRYYGSIYIDTQPVSTVTSSGKIYILETLIYDLTQPENNQLLSVITTKIDNPETLGKTSKDFSKKLVSELIK